MRKFIQQILLITTGVVLMAIASTLFFAPHSIASGGVYGMAVIIHHLFPSFTIGVVLLAGNVLMYILGLLLLGKRFGLLTLYGTISYSVANIVLERFFPLNQPLSADPLVSVLIGAGLMAVGYAMVMLQRATTGGTDILVRILHDYVHITLSEGVLVTDGIVVLLSAFFISIESSLYAVIGVYASSLILEQVITGADRRLVMTIISKEVAANNRYINIEMNRGTTLYAARGGYSKRAHDIIITVVQRHEYIRIKDFVERMDPNAFVYVYHSSEVMGEGFTKHTQPTSDRDQRASNYVE